MADATSQTIHFYNRHPISCDIILAKLRESARPSEQSAAGRTVFRMTRTTMAVRRPQTNWRKEQRLGKDLVLPISARGSAAQCDISPIDMGPTSLELS